MKHATTLLTLLLAAGSLAAQGLPGSPTPEATSDRQVVEAVLARLRSGRATLRQGDRRDFAHARTIRTDRQQLIHRFAHTYRDLRVWGAETIVATDLQGNAQGEPVHVTREAVLDDVTPVLNAAQAIRAGQRPDASPWQGASASHLVAPKAELLLVPVLRQARVAGAENKAEHELNALDVEEKVDGYKLAYYVQVREARPGRTPVFTDTLVDARTGAVIQQWDALQHGPAAVTGKTMYSGTVTLGGNLNGSSYELKDPSRSGFYVTPYNSSTVYASSSAVFGDGTSSNTTTAAADVMWGLNAVYDMLLNCYGWKGLDNYNKGIKATVHMKDDNAYFDGSNTLNFGDGVSMFNPLVSVDVVAHEYGHAVCAATANLTYSGESGGLNESNSDIIGEVSEFYANGGKTGSTVPEGTSDWVTGAKVGKNGPLRYMYKPSKDGSSPDAWSSSLGNLDVHYSSGPNNRAFYFLAEGSTSSGDTASTYLKYGPMTGLGITKAGAIWMRALTTKMTSSSNYAAVRTACINAATDLYGAGSPEVIAVQRAYAAINVGSDVAPAGGLTFTTQPASKTTTTGASVTFTVAVSGGKSPYTYQWTRNGGNVAGATAASYTFTTAAADNGASYACTVTDSSSPALTATSATATLTLSDVSAPDLVKNGSFESGVTSWSGTTGVIGNWSGNNQPAYDGVASAWLGGNGKTTTETLYQTVTIPSTATKAVLSFYLHIDTAESGTTVYDKLAVQVRNNSGTLLKTLATYSNANAASGYVLRSFDLSAYKGQTIRVHFNMTEDASLQTSFVVDKVSLVTQ